MLIHTMARRDSLQTLSKEVTAAHERDDASAMRRIVLSPGFLSTLADSALQSGLDRPLGSYLNQTSLSLLPYQEDGVVSTVRDLIVNGRESVRNSQHGATLLAAASRLDLPVFERGNPYYAAGIANNLGRVNIRSFYEGDIPLKKQGKHSIARQSQIVTTVASVLSGTAEEWIEADAFSVVSEAIAPVVEAFTAVQLAVGRLMCEKYCPGM